jgi:hypothetical protein
MNGRSQMLGGKNWILLKEKCEPVLLRLSLAGNLCWNFKTIYGGWEPSRNRVVVPARQAT